MQQCCVDQEIEASHRKDPSNQRARDVPAGSGEFFSEINRASPTVVSGDHGLEGQHHRHEQVQIGWDEAGGCLHSIGEGQRETGHHQGRKDHGLDQSQKLLAGSTGAHPRPLDQREERQDPDGDPGAADRHQRREVIPQGGDDPGQANAVGNPVAPADEKSSPTPKGGFGVDVPAPRLRHGCCQFRHTDGTQQGVGGS